MLLRRRLQKLFSTTTPNGSVTCYVDGKPVNVPSGSVIIQACQAAGIDIPRFCYHERLAIAGNCRMCLVSVEKMPKLVASCAYPVMPDMRITTNSPAVHKAREGVMEFLLANHPLDCVICDQGGECDLQDQSMHFGSDRSRWAEEGFEKRAVEDKEFGPLVKTSMNRCIHCTRCVRFGNDIAGMTELGTSGRGHHMEIGTYVSRVLDNPLSGNIIDLCPVGALTSKPYAFTARPWELKRTESVDVMDAVGSAIRIDSRGSKVMRILPRLNEAVNEEWLADKSRFAYDGLSNQRLLHPMIKNEGKWDKTKWIEALSIVASRLNSTKKVCVVAGDFTDAETLVSAKNLDKKQEWNFVIDEWLGQPLKKSSVSYIPRGLAGIEARDAIVLLGTDPMKEAPLLATRIRKAWLKGARVFNAGKKPKFLPFEPEYLSADTKLADLLNDYKDPLVLYGDSLLNQLGPISISADQGVVLRQAGRAAAIEIGYTQQPVESEMYILLGADTNISVIPERAFVVYIGHHGDAGAERADVILPGCSYAEKEATYVNLEGRVQRTRSAVPPPGDARVDWQILSAIGEVAGIESIRSDLVLLDHLSKYKMHRANTFLPLISSNQFEEISITNSSLVGEYAESESVIRDYYLTDVISRASATMAKCSEAFN